MDATRWLIGLAVGLTACFSPSTAPDGGMQGSQTDGGTGTNTGAITASWTLSLIAGGAGTCPADTGTMKVSITALDPTGTEDGSPNVGLFDCTAGSGSVDVPHTMDDQDTGTFHVRWDITDATGDTVTSTDLLTHINAPTVVDTSRSRHATTNFVVDGAFAWVEWTLSDSSATPYTSCTDANVDQISVALTDTDGGDHDSTPVFECSATNNRPAGFQTQGEDSVGGALAAVPLGDYGVDATALRASANVGDTTTTSQLFLDAPNAVSPTPLQLAISVTTAP